MRRCFGFLAAAAIGLAAETREFTSGENRTQLLELFTSEGCSSCPPAEAWLVTLGAHSGLWRDFVPVAWHVDYWDRLGWKDRFASRAATERQHGYARDWSSGSVYTPCFVLSGAEWRGRGAAPTRSNEPAGVLRATHASGRVDVHFAPPTAGDYDAHAVLLGLDLRSRVTRGENAGRDLRHAFVAVTSPVRARVSEGAAELVLPPPPADIADLALAVWVTRAGEHTPLQATGGPLTASR